MWFHGINELNKAKFIWNNILVKSMSVLVQHYERVTHFHAYPFKMFSSLISQIC